MLTMLKKMVEASGPSVAKLYHSKAGEAAVAVFVKVAKMSEVEKAGWKFVAEHGFKALGVA